MLINVLLLLSGYRPCTEPYHASRFHLRTLNVVAALSVVQAKGVIGNVSPDDLTLSDNTPGMGRYRLERV